MNQTYKVLHLEDVSTDAELAAREMKKYFQFQHHVVDTEEAYLEALEHFAPDIILCDHSLPAFNSLEALKIVQAKKLLVPFILITATMSEEFAVDVIKSGADDYILKDRLNRLPIAVKNAMEKFRLEKERQASLAELEKNERKFRSIIENGTDGVVILTATGTPTYVSPTLNKILGYSEQEAMNLTLFDILHPDDSAKTGRRLKICLNTPGIPLPRTETQVKHRNGNWMWMDATMTNMLHEPVINGIVVNFRDITERKHAEQAIRESEEKYRSLFENSMDGILLTSTEGKIFAANPAACHILKRTEAEICSGGREAIADMSDPRLYALLKERQTKGKTKGEIRFVKGDGTVFPCEMSSVSFDPSSPVSKTSIVFRDITSRKLAEEKQLTTSKNLLGALHELKKIMDSSIDVICTFDANGCFTNASSASLAVWGYAPDELIGTKYIDLVYEEDIDKTKEVAELITSGVSVTMFENRYKHKNGFEVPILWSATWDATDQLMYCIAKDVTKKKRLEQAFEAERLRFYDIFSNAPSSLGIMRGPLHVFEMVNEQYLQLTGRTNIIGKTVREVFPELENQGLFDLLDYVYTTGKTVSAKERPVEISKNGEEQLLYLDFMYQAFRNRENKIDGVFFFAVDVTEQVVSRKRIEESEKQFRQIVETAQEGIWMLDEMHRTKFVNSKMCQILGYSKAEIMGQPTTEFITKDEIGKRYFSTGSKANIDVYEEKLLRKDGKEVWVYMSTNPLLDKSGNYLGALAMVTDITERKRLQEKIIKQKVQQQKEITKAALQAQEKERNHLGSELHDNINQILTAVKLYLKHYLDTPNSSAKIIESSHHYLSTAIEEIRNLSQNLVTHRFDTYSFGEVVRSFVEKQPIREMIELDMSCLDETTIQENIKLTLFRIIQEQLNNVAKYANASAVSITVHNDDKLVRLVIRDNGVGFDTKQKRTGVGITNICNRVESYNGTVFIQSNPGQGCILSLHIPLQQPLSLLAS